jgi:hypothetical protein
VLATSFHPEMTGDLRVHRYFLELVRATGDAVRPSLTKLAVWPLLPGFFALLGCGWDG